MHNFTPLGFYCLFIALCFNICTVLNFLCGVRWNPLWEGARHTYLQRGKCRPRRRTYRVEPNLLPGSCANFSSRIFVCLGFTPKSSGAIRLGRRSTEMSPQKETPIPRLPREIHHKKALDRWTPTSAQDWSAEVELKCHFLFFESIASGPVELQATRLFCLPVS